MFNRNLFTTFDQPTLQDVLDTLESDTALSLQRRRNLCSSVRTLGKLMGKRLTALPAHPGYYRQFMNALHPERCGLSKSRISNIKSDVLFALRHTGCIQKGHTHMAPLTSEWQALWDEAACAGRLKFYVSRIMHYCSARGILPVDVNDGVSEQLKLALIDDSFAKSPIRTHKNIIRTWNKLVDRVPGWPKTRLTLTNDRDDYSIPLERFPKVFQDEIDALVDHWAGKDILDDTGPDKPLKPRTIKGRLYRLRQIVSALVLKGRNIEEIVSISQIVEIDAAKIVLRFYLDRAGDETTSQVHGLAILIKTLAKHWVKVDQAHLDTLKTLCAKVDPNIKGLTEKNRERLRQFDEPRNVGLLLDFPSRQVEEIERHSQGLRNEAVTVQIALAVELLLMAPVRAENLVNINIDRHIQRSRTGLSVRPGTL